MKTRFLNRTGFSNSLILIMIFLTSCSLDSTLEDINQAEDLEESEILTETDSQYSNMRLMSPESCEDYCIEPGTSVFYPVSDMATQTVGINTKSVSYSAYNTETDFIVEVTYKITAGPANARASISINIEGNEIRFNSVKSGSTVNHKIPLAEDWSGCNDVKFSISQKGLGQPININNSYSLFPVCKEVIEESPIILEIGDSYQGGIIAYFFKPSDNGYDRGLKGIIVAERDLPTKHIWKSSSPNNIFSGLSPMIGYGDINTKRILALADSLNFRALAARQASQFEGGNYNDWFLPSEMELLVIKENLANNGLGNFFTEPIGGNKFSTGYWSSSIMANLVGARAPFFARNFGVCGCAFFESYWVRPVRYF